MHHANGRRNLVHVLPARPTGVEDIYAQLFRLDIHVHFVRLWQHGDCGGRGVDPALGLGYRHTLHAVHAALVFQETVSVRSLNLADHFFQSTLLGLTRVDDVYTQAVALCVALVHAEEVTRKERRLVTSGAATDLHDYVLAVVRVLGKQRFA